MHAASVGGGGGGGGSSRRSTSVSRSGSRSYKSSKASKAASSSGDDDKKGDGDDEKAGMGPVYRIGKHKFRLDGKDGKTLDDIIEELVATSGSDRNWKGMFISLLVIVSILGLITLSVVIMREDEDDSPRLPKVTFGDFLSDSLSGNAFNGTWISDTEMVFVDEHRAIVLATAPNMSHSERRVLVPNTTYVDLGPSSFAVSPDHKFVFLAHESFKSFRYSFWARYTIYDVEKGVRHPVMAGTPAAISSSKFAMAPQPHLEYLGWGPTGNAFVYVYKSNIYYRPSVESSKAFPITTDGETGVVSNGVPDWVYEEEVLAQNHAMWFSPAGNRLAFIRFNDSMVREVKLPLYEPDSRSPYVRHRPLRYPKAGTANPEVSLRVVDLQSLDGDVKTNVVDPPPIIGKGDHYIVGVKWANSDVLSVVWAVRAQNLSVVTHCSPNSRGSRWRCSEKYRETTKLAGGWVDSISPLYHPDADRKEFLVLAPVLDGSHGHFRHIMRVQFGGYPVQRPITQGRFDVRKIHGWDADRTHVFYSSSPPGEPSNLQVYRIAAPGGPNSTLVQSRPECVTCHLVEAVNQTETEINLFLAKHVAKKVRINGEETLDLPKVLTYRGCLYNEAHFSKGLGYFVVDCRGPDVPQVRLYNGVTLQEELILDDNPALRARVANMSLPKVRMFRVPTESGYEASVRLYLPPEITFETFTSFPLLVQVYAGPGTQTSRARWKMGWPAYLASSRGIIVAQIDGRGSGGEGDRRRFELWNRLGSVEVQDQIEVVRHLVSNLSIINPRQIAIWGWSYGGYVTLRALSDEDQDVFQCGIAVAPVTDWRYYDSVYTERYMGQPGVEGNYKGYEESDVTRRAGGFHPTRDTLRKLYLVHGSRDDNVHLQHSMALSKALVREGVAFKQQIYPDDTHSMSGSRTHFYSSMESFLTSCFDEVSESDESTGRFAVKDAAVAGI